MTSRTALSKCNAYRGYWRLIRSFSGTGWSLTAIALPNQSFKLIQFGRQKGCEVLVAIGRYHDDVFIADVHILFRNPELRVNREEMPDLEHITLVRAIVVNSETNRMGKNAAAATPPPP